MSSILEIRDKNHYDEIMNSSYSLIIVDIYADWCSPCKYLQPKLEELSRQLSSEDILFCKLNSELGIKNNVKSLPTIEFWHKLDLVNVVIGADLDGIKRSLSNLIDKYDLKIQSQSSGIKNIYGGKKKSSGGNYYASYGNL